MPSVNEIMALWVDYKYELTKINEKRKAKNDNIDEQVKDYIKQFDEELFQKEKLLNDWLKRPFWKLFVQPPMPDDTKMLRIRDLVADVEKDRQGLLTPSFEGFMNFIEQRYKET